MRTVGPFTAAKVGPADLYHLYCASNKNAGTSEFVQGGIVFKLWDVTVGSIVVFAFLLIIALIMQIGDWIRGF